jgi:hypothetical protein
MNDYRMGLWPRLKLLWGRPRRLFLHLFRQDLIREGHARRRGECKRCGACCRMGSKCLHLKYDDEGLSLCAKYDKTRPPNCRNFPINEKDLSERDQVLPDRPCGFWFEEKNREESSSADLSS